MRERERGGERGKRSRVAIIKRAGRAIKYSRNGGDDSFRPRGNRASLASPSSSVTP